MKQRQDLRRAKRAMYLGTLQRLTPRCSSTVLFPHT